MNKIDRLKSVFEGKMPDVIPAGFWFHYRSDYSVDQMVEAHLDLYRKTDMDIIKIMQDYPYPIIGEIKEPEDWYKIKVKDIASEEFKKMSEIIKKIADQVGNEVMIFQTMFGPFKAASMLAGDELLMKHCKENPDAVLAGVNIIANALEQWANAYLDAGADGIYYSAQFGEVGRFSHDQWEKTVYPSDLQILKVAEKRQNKYNILHICGEPEYDFETHVDRYRDYPMDLVNWSVKDNHYSLERGKDFFNGPVLGGLNNKGNILNGTEEDIINEVNEVISGVDIRGFMLGADCTIQGENISIDKIKIAVDAAHNYQI